MITWGINALNHDASISVFAGDEFKLHQRASEFSGKRGDDQLNSDLVRAAINASNGRGPSEIVWYEKPLLKKFRQIRAGQWNWAFDRNELPKRYLSKFALRYPKIIYGDHHRSHAAAGFFTSPFETATVVVLDAIGEWESATIWRGQGTKLEKVWSRSYYRLLVKRAIEKGSIIELKNIGVQIGLFALIYIKVFEIGLMTFAKRIMQILLRLFSVCLKNKR